MLGIVMLALAASLWAETSPPVRILKGELVEWDVRGLAGELAVRQADHKVERCRVLPDTFITRELLRVAPVGVRVGDTVEVVGDFREGPNRCAAMTVYIRPPDLKKRATGDSPLRSSYTRSLLDGLWPRGVLGYAGIVSKVDDKHIVLRTRQQGEKTFNVREDTLFSDTGRPVEPGDLQIYTRVYVRANRSFEGRLDAMSVVWGAILTPGR